MASYGEKVINTILARTGSTWVTRKELKEYCQKYGGSVDDIANSYNVVCCDMYADCESEYLYSTKYYSELENNVVSQLFSLQFIEPQKPYSESTIKKYVEQFETEENHGRKLHYHQVDAVVMVCNSNFSVLTGGPGTGKTTVLSAITYVLRKLEPNTSIVFTAPTGKAARRVTESTGEYSCTLHKKLGIGIDGQHESNFWENVLFVDECSMNDIALTSTLFKTVPQGRRIVFVGDVDQLPSVGPGAVLRDLISSHTVPVTELTHTFRQDNSSMLFYNICNVRQGLADLKAGPDFEPLMLNGINISEQAVKTICEKFKYGIDKYGVENCVVLLPYRKKGICSNKINVMLQQIANPEKQGFRHYCHADDMTIFFKKNDLVMQLSNRNECANGDVGTITDVSELGVTVQYSDVSVHYSPAELDQLTLAYAMTIHKSQGSEYQYVIMCMLNEHKSMLVRNLIYTGITRAKKECSFIYEEMALKTALKTVADSNRTTLLTEKLESMRNQYRIAYGI